MKKERLQNSISGSVFTLPVCSVITILLLLAPFADVAGTLQSIPFWGKLSIVALTTYVMIELNNRNTLLRIRSRMVSSVWLVIIGAVAHVCHTTTPPSLLPFLNGSLDMALLCTLFMAISFSQLFRTYQQRDCVVCTFHYALFLGITSIFLPHSVVFLPMFLWHQTAFLRSTTLRTFCASLIGFFFPWFFIAAWCMVTDNYQPILTWYADLTGYVLLAESNYTSLSLQQIASWSLVSLLGIVGSVHYLSTSYNDKIQVRMFFYIFVIQFFSIDAFVALQPQHFNSWMPLLVLHSSPIIAHFFALTRSWFTNFLFMLSMMAVVALAYVNIFMEAVPFTLKP